LPISLFVLPAGKTTTLAKFKSPLYSICISAGGA
jgi:hypothetical protein